MFGRLLHFLPLKTLRGYQHPELVDVVYQKTLEYQPAGAWSEMIGVSAVLDFGGGCGRHHKDAVQSSPGIRWAVVETEPMVRRAKPLETDHLKFFSDIGSAAQWLGDVEVVHSNGALQYVNDPIGTAAALCALQPRRLIWDRLPLGNGHQDEQISLLGSNGPGKQKMLLKRVAYTRTTIREADFLKAHDGYRLEARGDDWFKFSR